MAFETLVMSDIQVEQREQLPTGEYVFQLLPTAEIRINKYNGMQELNMSAAVAEGDHKGRRVFWNYPDPDPVDENGTPLKPLKWSAQAMKKLEVVLGEDSQEGETPKDYFNRVASSGNARFSALYGPNQKKPYIPQGSDVPRNELQIFSVKAAA